jgi:hypothetical protein
MNEEKKVVMLSVEELKNIVTDAGKEALKAFNKEQYAKEKKQKLYNTSLLMEHYIDFQDHFEAIKYKASSMLEVDLKNIDMDVEDVMIRSIKRSKTRTWLMINQIETAVKLVEKDLDEKNEPEKIKAIKYLYMDKSLINLKFNARVLTTAELMNCHEATVRRWKNEILSILAVKLFGVDGLKLDF